MSDRLLEVETLQADGQKRNMYIPYVASTFRWIFFTFYLDSYDKLVIAVGSSSATHGVSGLENCFQLKTISDARAIRRRIMGLFMLYLEFFPRLNVITR